MGEVENIFADKSANNGLKGKSRKKRIVRPYITVPLVFALLAALLLLPIMFRISSASDKIISAAEKEFSITDGDIEVNSDAGPSAESQQAYQNGSFVGTLVCENAGIHENIYFGANRASLRNGAALSENGSVFIEGETAYLMGYSSSAFKALPSVKAGDTFIITASNSVFEYEVTEIASSASDLSADLILSCTDGYNFYGGYDKFVLANLVSKVPLSSQQEVAQ